MTDILTSPAVQDAGENIGCLLYTSGAADE